MSQAHGSRSSQGKVSFQLHRSTPWPPELLPDISSSIFSPALLQLEDSYFLVRKQKSSNFLRWTLRPYWVVVLYNDCAAELWIRFLPARETYAISWGRFTWKHFQMDQISICMTTVHMLIWSFHWEWMSRNLLGVDKVVFRKGNQGVLLW